jgi:hypothetical protein
VATEETSLFSTNLQCVLVGLWWAGKMQFKVRSSVLKKERENDWRNKFPGMTCEATMKRIRKE